MSYHLGGGLYIGVVRRRVFLLLVRDRETKEGSPSHRLRTFLTPFADSSVEGVVNFN